MNTVARNSGTLLALACVMQVLPLLISAGYYQKYTPGYSYLSYLQDRITKSSKMSLLWKHWVSGLLTLAGERGAVNARFKRWPERACI